MKRFISVLLVIATLVSMMSCLAGCGKTEEYITRGEWITALGERFGMDSTISEKDYFTDVNEAVPCYAYVQSCGDWGVLSNAESTSFKPDEDATVEFALETAILASEVDTGEQSVVDYAIANGIIKDAGFMSVRGRLTPEVAEQIITWTQDLYINGVVEPRAEVEYNPDLQILTDEADKIEESPEEDGTYVIPAEMAESLSNGDVLLMPDDEYVDGVGVKVDEIVMNDDGTATVTTLDPEISELLDGLDVAGPVVWSQKDIQLADGFSFGGAGGLSYSDEYDGVYVSTLNHVGEDRIQAQQLANGIIPDINLNVNFTKGTVSLNPSWDSLFGLGESFSMSATESQYATDPQSSLKKPGEWFNKTSVIPVGSAYGNEAYKNQLAINAYKEGKIDIEELKKELDLTKDQQEKNPKTMENKFSGGYEITGSLKISAIKLDVEAKYSVFSGLKASLTCNYKVTSSLSIKGKLSESLNFMTVRVPVAAGLTVDVKFYLCLDANGELTVTATLSNSTKYSLDDGKVKKTGSTSGAELSGSVSCKIDFGPKISIELTALGVPLVDAGIKAVVRAKGKAELKFTTEYSSEINDEGDETLTITRRTLWGYGVTAYIPIITLEVNGNPKTIGNKLKLNASWTLIGESKAKKIPILEEQEVVLWEEVLTLTDDKEAEETEATEITEATEDGDVTYGDFLDIDSYFLSLDEGGQASIGVSIIPKGYSMSDLVWSSSNTAVATVSGGLVTAVNGGVATITVRTRDGKFYKQCGISVTAAGNEFTPLDENMGKVSYA